MTKSLRHASIAARTAELRKRQFELQKVNLPTPTFTRTSREPGVAAVTLAATRFAPQGGASVEAWTWVR